MTLIETQRHHHLTLSWTSDPVGDVLADSVIAMILQFSSNPHQVLIKEERSVALFELVKKQFGEVTMNKQKNQLQFAYNGSSVQVCVNVKQMMANDFSLSYVNIKFSSYFSSAD